MRFSCSAFLLLVAATAAVAQTPNWSYQGKDGSPKLEQARSGEQGVF